MKAFSYPTPLEIVKELDKYIIGQKEAKKHVAIALRNRWRRLNVKSSIKKEINPNNILMIGPTGVGKTEIARRIASIADAPFIKVEASKFTEVGYVGRDVESMVRDLVECSVKQVRETHFKQVRQKAEKMAESIIIDRLMSLPKGNPQEEEKIEKTRQFMLEKLRKGDLDDKEIEISIEQKSTVSFVSGNNPEMSMMGIQEAFNEMLPKKQKRKRLLIKEARKILIENQSNKLIDLEKIHETAIEKAENTGIIFIDEIDKIAIKGGDNSISVSRQGVQRDLLPIVEGSSVNTKYGIVNTEHILFIGAGAFHQAKPSDMIPELQGRFPIRVELDSLTEEDFYLILKTPKNALIKQYQALLEAERVEIVFEEDALREIAFISYEANLEIENIGARRLHTVLTQLLSEYLFNIPDKIPPDSKITITQKMVKVKLESFLQNKNLTQYIL